MQARTVTIVSAAMIATLSSVFLVARSTANRAAPPAFEDGVGEPVGEVLDVPKLNQDVTWFNRTNDVQLQALLDRADPAIVVGILSRFIVVGDFDVVLLVGHGDVVDIEVGRAHLDLLALARQVLHHRCHFYLIEAVAAIERSGGNRRCPR